MQSLIIQEIPNYPGYLLDGIDRKGGLVPIEPVHQSDIVIHHVQPMVWVSGNSKINGMLQDRSDHGPDWLFEHVFP